MEASVSEIISIRGDGILELRLNRPEKKNALTRAMYVALVEGLSQASADEDIRAVVLSAVGDDFCAGNDIQDFVRDLPVYQAGGDHEALPVFQFLKSLTFFDKPLIAAVKGKAVGVGVTMLLHCDLVVAADTSALSLPFMKLGLVPEAGSTLLLPERIGYGRAFGWMALGETLGAEQALTLGLVNRVVPVSELAATAADMARTVAQLSPAAVRSTKALLRDPQTLWPVVQAEGEVFRQLLTQPDTQAAFAAFLAR